MKMKHFKETPLLIRARYYLYCIYVCTLHLIVPFPRLQMWFKVCIISVCFYLTIRSQPATFLYAVCLSNYPIVFFSRRSTMCWWKIEVEKKSKQKRKEWKNRSNSSSVFVESDTGEGERERLLFAIRNQQNGFPLFVFAFAQSPWALCVPRLSPKWSPINFHILQIIQRQWIQRERVDSSTK